MKIYGILFLLTLAIGFTSCGGDKADKTTKGATTVEAGAKGYTIDPSTMSVGFTAFKTTEKLPVKGEFKNLSKKHITSSHFAKTMDMALDNVNFEIPVSRLKTGDETRDFIIKKFFFGTMNLTGELVGSLQVNKENTSTGSMALRMNDVTFKFPIKIAYEKNQAKIKGLMNLDDWKTDVSQAELHKNCEEKHKGKDGVSKTWKTVEVEGSISIIKK